jgi:hypothetical protein
MTVDFRQAHATLLSGGLRVNPAAFSAPIGELSLLL